MKRTIDQDTLSAWIEICVEKMLANDSNETYSHEFDDELALFIGWQDGYAVDDERVIHSLSEPKYAICIKIADAKCVLYEDAYMPWDVDGNVYDTSGSIDSHENYSALAQIMIGEYKTIRSLMNKGKYHL